MQKFLKSFVLSVFALSVFTLSTSANASLITNGSFESTLSGTGAEIGNIGYGSPYNVLGDPLFIAYTEGRTDGTLNREQYLSDLDRAGNWGIYDELFGWSVLDVNTPDIDAGIEVQYSGTVATASDGNKYLELDTNGQLNNGQSNGGIFQDLFGLVVGQSYTLSFDYQGRLANPDKLQSNGMKVSWGEGDASLNEVDNVTEVGTASGTWTTYTRTLMASAETMRIQFEGSGDADGKGALLDNVSLSAVAIPEPSVISLMLFALCGIAMRKKS